jgi:hypothetical protein
MIPPAAQRAMSERAKAVVTETPGSHAVYVSRPAVAAAVISQAAQGRLPGLTWLVTRPVLVDQSAAECRQRTWEGGVC